MGPSVEFVSRINGSFSKKKYGSIFFLVEKTKSLNQFRLRESCKVETKGKLVRSTNWGNSILVSRHSGVGPPRRVINGKKCDQINNSVAPQTSSVKHDWASSFIPPTQKKQQTKKETLKSHGKEARWKVNQPVQSKILSGGGDHTQAEVWQDVAENHCEGWTCQTVSQCMQENVDKGTF